MHDDPKSSPADEARAMRPLRMLWYWPHPHRGDNLLASSALLPGDTLTVECLQSFRDEPLDDEGAAYTKIRDLPDVSHTRTGIARILDRLKVHAVRAWRRRRLARSGRFDVLYIETLSLLDAVTLRGLKRRLPVVTLVHDVEPHKRVLPPRLQDFVLRQAYLQSSQLVVLHDTIKSRLVERFALDPARVTVIPHALEGRWGARPEHEGPPVRLLVFGSLRPNKGIDVLLDAVENVDPSLVSVVIAGSGDRALEQRVTAAANRLRHVTAEIDYLTPERKVELFRAADIVVLPYRESFTSQSGVLLDSYAYGLPSIVTDVGAIGPTVRSEHTGWVVPPSDAAALARVITEVAEDPEGRRKAEAAIAAVLDHYDQVNVGRLLREIYDRSCARGRGRD
ncbi:MAG: glycosyltransferase family 4 protein [Actinobacteria bacterium]|nr:glycosyltransferase family 4 protein [Actinomycetota bacterium]